MVSCLIFAQTGAVLVYLGCHLISREAQQNCPWELHQMPAHSLVRSSNVAWSLELVALCWLIRQGPFETEIQLFCMK